jgi:hypothetical protein
VALGAGLLVGAGHYLTRDIAPMRGGEGSVPDMREMRLLHHQVAVACEGAEGLEAARGIARRLWLGRVNPYTGLPVVEEPSPGNYELALRDGKVLYFHVDARGARIGGDRW